MYCRQCGKEISSDSVFCEYCGTQIDDTTGQKVDNKKIQATKICCQLLLYYQLQWYWLLV